MVSAAVDGRHVIARFICPHSKFLRCIQVPRQASVDTIHAVVVTWQLSQRFMNVLPLSCLFYSDTEKFRFVMFETLFKCLNKVLRAFCFLDKNSGLSS